VADSTLQPAAANRGPLNQDSTAVYAGQFGASGGDSVEDSKARIEALLKVGDPADADEFSALFSEWVRKDPAAAARFAEFIAAGEMRDEAIRRAAQWWAVQDSVTAESWAAQLPDENERKRALCDVCFQVAQQDGRQAVLMAEQHGLGAKPEAILEKAVIESLVEIWAKQDFPGAAAWVGERSADEQRDHMFARLALVESETDPANAAQLVVERIPAGPIQTEAAFTVLYHWAARDPDGAAAWGGIFPDSLRERAENELAAWRKATAPRF
jgi:hypothetical protein